MPVNLSTDFEKVFLGKQLGVGLVKRGPEDGHVCLVLLTEDDGNWFRISEDSITSSYWLEDLAQVTLDVHQWLDKNCDPDLDENKQQWGWKFRG